jgi:hypothetical protein
MKKLAVVVLIAGMAIFGSNALDAKAIGGKIIYNKMMDDYTDPGYDFDNNLSGGGFFELGPSFYGSRFRPGLDWVTLENDNGRFARVYGIHLDWYWFFMDGKTFNPFIGFGPSLNYINYRDNHSIDDDSDAGIEGFAGFEFNFSSPWSLIAEARLVQHDIADLGARIFKVSVGIVYYFN